MMSRMPAPLRDPRIYQREGRRFTDAGSARQVDRPRKRPRLGALALWTLHRRTGATGCLGRSHPAHGEASGPVASGARGVALFFVPAAAPAAAAVAILFPVLFALRAAVLTW